MKNLIIRSLTGLVIVFVMLTCVASENAWYFVLWSVIGVASVLEYLSLLGKNRANVSGSYVGWQVVGSIYILLPMVLLCTLYREWNYVVMLLTVVWMNDVAAYAIGSLIGKHRLAPSISPKKSVEGFVAGLVASVALALIWWLFFFKGLTTPTDASTVAKIVWAVMGLIIGLGAVAGDLVESKFKRMLKVKDSGKLLAGHGGMLDRFDALFAAAILFWLYVKFVLPLLQI